MSSYDLMDVKRIKASLVNEGDEAREPLLGEDRNINSEAQERTTDVDEHKVIEDYSSSTDLGTPLAEPYVQEGRTNFFGLFSTYGMMYWVLEWLRCHCISSPLDCT